MCLILPTHGRAVTIINLIVIAPDHIRGIIREMVAIGIMEVICGGSGLQVCRRTLVANVRFNPAVLWLWVLGFGNAD